MGSDSQSEDDSDNMMITPNDSPPDASSPVASKMRYGTSGEEFKMNGEINPNSVVNPNNFEQVSQSLKSIQYTR